MFPVKWQVRDVRMLMALSGLFWYLALFPGILGPDNSVLIRKMQLGQSTNQWTGIYYRFIQILTFDGRLIFIASLVFLFLYATTLYYFVRAIPVSEKIQNWVLCVFSLTPFYGVYGVSINHDLTFTCGFLILLRIWLIRKDENKTHNVNTIVLELFGLLLLATHASGYPIILAHFILRFLIDRKTNIMVLVTFILLLSASNFGVEADKAPAQVRLFLAEIKCIVQDEDSSVSSAEWNYLDLISKKDYWQTTVACDDIDKSILVLGEIKYNEINQAQLIKNFLTIAAKNPQTYAMSRIAKSSPVLPPVFFSAPPNAINTDFGKAIGYNSAQDLAVSAGVFHPSVDEPSVDFDISQLKPLWAVAEGVILVINQASWFWGWGGLWTLPFIVLALILKSNYTRLTRVSITLLYLSNNLFLVLFMPAPSPRYAMHQIVLGLLSFLFLIKALWIKYRTRFADLFLSIK